MDQAAQRATRLTRLLDSFIKGFRNVKTANDVKLFLEALCSQQDRATCVERIAASHQALESLKIGLRFDISTSFINGPLKDFLTFLSDPVVKLPCSGDLMKQLLAIIVEPPTLWFAIVNACKTGSLSSEAKRGFSWLLLELLCWTENPPIDVDITAREVSDSRILVDAENEEIRSFGRRILHVLEAKQANFQVSASGPGGRHDNDFVDYRRVAIYPTDQELTCKEKPFYRRADALGELPIEARVNVHLDNQFRLLREDFLAELREDIGTSGTKKQARRPKTRLRGLALAGYYCGKYRSKAPFCLALSAKKGFGPFAGLQSQDRKIFLRENTRFLKHQSFGCVLDGSKVVSFATLFRIEEPLMEDPPAIVLRIPGEAALEKLLVTLKTPDQLEFVLMDTPVFAYEPILSCLQDKVELPLWRQILTVNSKETSTTDYVSSISPTTLIERLENRGDQSLQDILHLLKPTQLDESQMGSLLSGLTQSVSLIQGPPGMRFPSAHLRMPKTTTITC